MRHASESSISPCLQPMETTTSTILQMAVFSEAWSLAFGDLKQGEEGSVGVYGRRSGHLLPCWLGEAGSSRSPLSSRNTGDSV
ncbi:hypothetical protein SRHO_G00094960 [Serrasalmus rhombeus]